MGFSPAKNMVNSNFTRVYARCIEWRETKATYLGGTCGRVGWVMTPLLMGYDMWIYLHIWIMILPGLLAMIITH